MGKGNQGQQTNTNVQGRRARTGKQLKGTRPRAKPKQGKTKGAKAKEMGNARQETEQGGQREQSRAEKLSSQTKKPVKRDEQ